MRKRILGGIIALCAVAMAAPWSVRAVGPITGITVAPAERTILSGTSLPFTVQGKDVDGVTADLTTNATFSVTDPSGLMTANTYNAGKVGKWVVTAHYSTLSADTVITVAPGMVNELIVNPRSEPEYLALGASRYFTVEGFDASNNEVTELTAKWSIEGSIGVVDTTSGPTVKFTGTKNGSGRLVAQSGDLMSAVSITVQPAPAPIVTNTNAEPINTTNKVVTKNVAPDEPANTNTTNVNTDIAAPVAAAADDSSGSTCAAWPRASWIWVTIAYAILLGAALGFAVKARPSWWWIAPLALTVATLWVYFQFRCYPVYPGLPYVVLLMGIVGASWYNWKRSEPPAIS